MEPGTKFYNKINIQSGKEQEREKEVFIFKSCTNTAAGEKQSADKKQHQHIKGIGREYIIRAVPIKRYDAAAIHNVS
jgi:hypothetical protein